MRHITERNALTRWYPLTYPGYYKGDLSKAPSLCHEHCRIDVSRLAGERIGIRAASQGEDAVVSLTDDEGKVIRQWKTVPEELKIPRGARCLYLNNRYDRNPDFYLLIPEKKRKTPNGFLFYEEFTGGSVPDENDFLERLPAEAVTPEGLVIPHGIENAAVLHKATALNDWCLTAEVTAPRGDEVICLGTRITQDRPCHHASLCCVDLAKGELRLYQSSTGREMPEEIMQRASLSGIVTKGEFTLRLERVNAAIRACVLDPAAGKEVSVTQEVMQEENPPASIAGGCRAGKMFDSPQIFALSGAPLLRRIYGVAAVFPKAIFFGDSLTQGAHNLPGNGWAQKCARDIGSSLTSGRGSGDIWGCLNQVRTMLPTLRPKVMAICIGGNNRGTTVSVETVRYLYEKFLCMAEYFGVIPIISTIPCPREHVAATNRAIRALGVMGSRFDLALAENHTEDGALLPHYFVTDNIHLNAEGNRILYDYFMGDFPWLRNL